MKIAVNTRLLVPAKMDGIARFSYETLQRISRAHPEVDFTLIFDRKIKKDSFDFPDNVSFTSLSPQARHPILWKIWFEFVLKRYLNKHKFDLFLSPEGWIPPQLNCPSLAVIHDLNFEHHPENILKSHRNFLTHYFPKYAERATRIATVSEYSKQDLISTYRISENKIDVVFNGANEEFKPSEELKQGNIRAKYGLAENYFIFIGTLHPRKNLENLFKSFDRFKEHSKADVDLVIVGIKKWWPESLENTYQSLKHKENIRFLGRLADEELSIVLGGALALTYLPLFEGFGIPILEAFQCETPVITSNVTSMPEVAGDAALLCSPHDTDEVSEAMLKIYEDEPLRSELVHKGLERAKNFSWERSSQLLWESMTNTMDKNGA